MIKASNKRLKHMVESRYGKRFRLSVDMLGDRLFFHEHVRADSMCGSPSDRLAVCARTMVDLPVCEVKGDIHRAMLMRNGRTDRDGFVASFQNWKKIEADQERQAIIDEMTEDCNRAIRGTLWFS